MDDKIRVYVVDKGRRFLYMRYRCPLTGKEESRSTGTDKPKQAAKEAAKWEGELQAGRYERTARMPWDELREQYETQLMPTVTPATLRNYASTLNAFEQLCRPRRVADLTTARISAFAAELRKERTREIKGKADEKPTVQKYRLTEASVGRHLRQLKAVARWANRQGILPKVPSFDMPKKGVAAKMKGRPITGEEFDRLIAAVPGVVGAKAAESWKLLLRGLWTSGLRLGEALALRWDHQPGGVSVRLDGKQSVLVFDAGSQKSGKVQLVALAPEAVQLLAPLRKETGFVFNVQRVRGEGVMARHPLKIGKMIVALGKAAGVVTDPEKGKTASAHDLRRSFGFRWSRRVMPATLKELMRHASVETTLTFYVGQNAAATAAELWTALGDTSVDTSCSPEQNPPEQRRRKTLKQGLSEHARLDSNQRPAD
ncbi:tyrosine-type recombinase/integrase [Pirellulimonas nuda]|uniref:tyrosine-type recombinase/integrase n=1 Tax=Pirellulimonas nuda TaxID=2528009 RepID=UPI0011A827B7